MSDIVAMIALCAFLLVDFPKGSLAKDLQSKAWLVSSLIAIGSAVLFGVVAIYSQGFDL